MSISKYKPDRPEAKVGAGVEVGALEVAGIGVGMLLPLVETLAVFSASSSLPVGEKLL